MNMCMCMYMYIYIYIYSIHYTVPCYTMLLYIDGGLAVGLQQRGVHGARGLDESDLNKIKS